MSFKMRPQRLINKFGVDLWVWTSSNFAKQEYLGGETVFDDYDSLDKADADKLHEPILPMSSHLAQLFGQLNGGGEVQGDLLWLSLGKYPIGTVVYSPTQGGFYKVTSRSSYDGYTEPHFFEYQLKGVDQDQTNPIADATNEGSLPSDLHPYPGG